MRICPSCGKETHATRCPEDGSETTLVVRDVLLGAQMGPFLLEERLGHGAFGVVYRAKHRETGGDVAIKLLKAELAADPAVLRRFEAEARNTHALHHPNTVRLVDFGVSSEGRVYLATEFIRGITLRDELRKQSPLNWQRAERIARQIAKSLGEAHARGLVHRDLKPENVMLVDQFGEPDFVKVLDFGIARSGDSGSQSTAGPVGTPKYMAPEQWLGMPLDGRTDLYALGLILFEMLAGSSPWTPSGSGLEAPLQWMNCHVEQPAPPLAARALGAPSRLCALVDQLLRKLPADRPASAAQVLAWLGEPSSVLHEAPAVSGGSGGHGRPPALNAEAEAGVNDETLAAIGPAAPVTATALATHEAIAEASDDASDAPRVWIQGRPRWIPLAASVVAVGLLLGLAWRLLPSDGDVGGERGAAKGAAMSGQAPRIETALAAGPSAPHLLPQAQIAGEGAASESTEISLRASATDSLRAEVKGITEEDLKNLQPIELEEIFALQGPPPAPVPIVSEGERVAEVEVVSAPTEPAPPEPARPQGQLVEVLFEVTSEPPGASVRVKELSLRLQPRTPFSASLGPEVERRLGDGQEITLEFTKAGRRATAVTVSAQDVAEGKILLAVQLPAAPSVNKSRRDGEVPPSGRRTLPPLRLPDAP